MPTKEIGPAKAVTQADRMLESKIKAMRNRLMLTPMLWAYASPNWYAPMGFDMRMVRNSVIPTIITDTDTLLQLIPEKLPRDQP